MLHVSGTMDSTAEVVVNKDPLQVCLQDMQLLLGEAYWKYVNLARDTLEVAMDLPSSDQQLVETVQIADNPDMQKKLLLR